MAPRVHGSGGHDRFGRRPGIAGRAHTVERVGQVPTGASGSAPMVRSAPNRHSRDMLDRTHEHLLSALRAASRAPLPARIEAHHRLVDDLGFDSLGIVSLAVAIEERFGRPILLDGWIGSVGSPSGLTVESLADWIEESLRDDVGTLSIPA